MGVSLTQEDVEERICNLYGHNIKIGKYTGGENKIKVTHISEYCHNHTWYPTAQNLLRGKSHCPICSLKDRSKNKTRTYLYYKNKLIEENQDYIFCHYPGDNIPLLCTEKIEMIHLTCGNTVTTSMNYILNRKGGSCAICAKNKKKTTEEYADEIIKLTNCEYIVEGDYKNCQTPIVYRHKKCGKSFSFYPKDFVRNYKKGICVCQECRFSISYKTKTFADKVKKLGYGKYEVKGNYIDQNTPIEILHINCNTTYSTKPRYFMLGHRCPICFGSHKGTTDSFKEEVFEFVGSEYSVESEYIDNHSPIAMRHNLCGLQYRVRPNSFKRGSRCPECSRKLSRGVRKINDCLRIKDVLFTSEKTYDHLRDLHSLRYDVHFTLLDDNQEEILRECIIEFDGIQHFSPTIWTRIKDILLQRQEAYENLIKLHEHDLLKNQFAELNDISLLRIRYDQEDKIEELIDDLLLRPDWYVENHNKFLSEDEYYAPFYESMRKFEEKPIKKFLGQSVALA